MFTDTHCHLASHKYQAQEISDLVQRAHDVNVMRMVTLATGGDDLAETLQLAESYDSITCGLGIHPCDVMEATPEVMLSLEHRLQHPQVVVIGETGLDYYHPAPEPWCEEEYRERQRHYLDLHFQLAQRYNLNIVLHTRDRKGSASFEDCVSIYQKYSSSVRAVFHCFPGNIERAERIIALGGLISFTGNVTFKNAVNVQKTVSHLPLGSFMLETDAPYLSPEPFRGQRNEPAYVAEIVKKVCNLKGVTPQELSQATEKLANEFFAFK